MRFGAVPAPTNSSFQTTYNLPMNASALLAEPEKVPPASAESVQRDIDWWISKSEEYTRELFGEKVSLRTKFVFPSLPWLGAIPVYDPDTLPTVEVLRRTVSLLGIQSWGGPASRHYHGCMPGGRPRLQFTPEGKAPSVETLGKSNLSLKQSGKPYLEIRSYVIAYGLFYSATREFFDLESETGFPCDQMPGPGRSWHASFRTLHSLDGNYEMRCSWQYAVDTDAIRGAREVLDAVPLTLM